MLPQFGYIVAQAGADSRPPPPPALPPLSKHSPFAYPPPPPSVSHEPAVSSSSSGPISYTPYYARQASPLPTSSSSSSSMALLPPPPPTYGAGDYYAKSVDTRPQPWQTESYRASPPTWYTPQPYFDPPPSSDDPYHSQYGSRWHDESPIDELNGTQMYRRLQEYNDLMTWMDNEFWEQSEEIYREKLQSLQEELRHIQEGTHSGFKEVLSDLEHKREQSIADAECFMEYQLTFAEQQYDQDMATVEDEYENERRNLHDTLMSAMEERRKQIKEDKDEGITDIEELFREAYSRVSHRRTLRKRTPFDKLSNGTSTRPETTRRRQVRTSSPHNINAQPTTKEEEELEADFMSMKGILPARRLNASGTTSRR